MITPNSLRRSGDSQTTISDIHVGMMLPELIKVPSTTMLFRFSAVTWNAHRIHYDQPYALSENHPGTLVQATMHGAFLLQMLSRFIGPKGRLISIQYSNRGRAIPDDTLTCGASITAVNSEQNEVLCDIWERNQHRHICAKGEARFYLPSSR